jgi:hypothetical protein
MKEDELLSALQPLIKEYGRGDSEHSGMQVQATLVYFCRTGKIKTDWFDVPGPLLVFAQKED